MQDLHSLALIKVHLAGRINLALRSFHKSILQILKRLMLLVIFIHKKATEGQVTAKTIIIRSSIIS